MGHYDECREGYCAACGCAEDSHGKCTYKWCYRYKGKQGKLKPYEGEHIITKTKKTSKKVTKSIKTITASQYADLEHLKRMISMHQQIKDELYEKVKQIVPEQTIDGDGLFDYMYNNNNS